MSRSKRLVVLCGPAFSGKSTLCVALRDFGWRIVSVDQILRDEGHEPGQGLPSARWKEAFAVATGRVRASLTGGQMTVVDDTAALRFLRMHWRAVAADCGVAAQLVVLTASEPLVRRRRDANKAFRHRPDIASNVFDEHLATFEWPDASEAALRLDATKHPSDLALQVAAALGRLT